MVGIVAETKTVKELLQNKKYKIEYYQREYKWGKKQVAELVTDLTSQFNKHYKESYEGKPVGEYPSYFLGPIIIKENEKEKNAYHEIVDGQQRLTSLTLLIIFLNNLQKKPENKNSSSDQVPLNELVVSTDYPKKYFNLAIEERVPCMKILYEGRVNEVLSANELVKNHAIEKGAETSVRNLYKCYQTIDKNFPKDLKRGEALCYFIEWLLGRVNLVRIQTFSDKDAYTIFETMNDRGLSLSSTDMLKSFLLANIDEEKRDGVNKFWKERIRDLDALKKLDLLREKVDEAFFKAWFRSQYAEDNRKRHKGASNEDFEIIGTEFHRWIGKPENGIGFKGEDSYLKFSTKNFKFYSKQYMKLLKASKLESLGTKEAAGLEHVCYNAQNGFTLQYMVLLAPLSPKNTPKEITKKIRITAQYIDILLTWRLWNSRQISYGGMQYAMFLVMKDIRAYRDRSASDLGEFLFARLQEIKRKEATFDPKSSTSQSEGLFLKGTNRKVLHRILARITDFVETQSRKPSRFKEFMGGEIDEFKEFMGEETEEVDGKKKKIIYELEHIWAYKYYENHKEEFSDRVEFLKDRDKFGGILLLPKSVNASLGSDPYKDKLKYYFKENLLASSLHPDCYKKANKGFNVFRKRFHKHTGLEFKPIEDFEKKDIDERGELYRAIAKLVWNPEDLRKVAKDPQG